MDMEVAVGSAPHLAHWLRKSVEMPPEQWAHVNSDYVLRGKLHESCQVLLRDAYEKGDLSALERVHEVLSFIYELDFSSADIKRVDSETQPLLRDIAATLERGMLEHEYRSIPEETISSYPTGGAEYLRWLKRLIANHPCSRHPFYHTFLPEKATAADLKYFLANETNLDPRFDDILAMMQVGVQGAAKIEIASNYFDEMGNGQAERIHSHIFQRTLDDLNIDAQYIRSNVLLEGRISGNISACLAVARRHYFKAIGYFGVTEFLAPRRSKFFAAAWRRNGLPESGVMYHEMHIKIDADHARGWFDNVIVPLIDKDPRIGREIALGSMIRLNSSARYLDAVVAHLEAQRAVRPVA